jgi:hypothetical protein
MLPTITIPANGPAYLPGARMLAVLAHPPSSPADTKWRQAELALCRSVLLAQQQIDPTWATREQSIIPEHLLFPATDIVKRLEKIQNLHGNRLAAAHVAIPFFRQALRIVAGNPAEIHRASTIDARIQRTIDQEADREDWLTEHGVNVKSRFPKNDHNFETRVFRPSLPVLHIAVAMAVAIDQSQKWLGNQPRAIQGVFYQDMGGPQINVADFLTDPALVRHVVNMAREYEDLISHLPKLRIPHIVRLRIEQPSQIGSNKTPDLNL